MKKNRRNTWKKQSPLTQQYIKHISTQSLILIYRYIDMLFFFQESSVTKGKNNKPQKDKSVFRNF